MARKGVIILILFVGLINTVRSACEPDVYQSKRIICDDWQSLVEVTVSKPWKEIAVKQQDSDTACDYGAFKQFPGATYLILKGLSFTSIGASCFSGLSSIDDVDLQNNKIVDFDLTSLNNSEVGRLTLDRNMITELNFGKIWLPKVRHIKLYGNRLDALKITDNQLPEIIDISAAHNRIKDIDIHLKNLYSLDLSENVISSLTKERLSSDTLEFLHLEHNEIRHFNLDSLSNLPKLKELYITQNNISILDASYNNISKVELDAENLNIESPRWENPFFVRLYWEKVEQLSLSHNAIETFYLNWFLSASIGIQELNLDHNQLTEIMPGAFLALKELFVLDLSHNQIKTVHKMAFRGLYKLSTLNLAHNCILSLEAGTFNGMSSIVSIDLGRNLLTHFPIPGWDGQNNTKIVMDEYHVSSFNRVHVGEI